MEIAPLSRGFVVQSIEPDTMRYGKDVIALAISMNEGSATALFSFLIESP